VDAPASLTSNQQPGAHRVFVSYATADRKKALAICNAIERRGIRCWISCRDVLPGENYQEAIVRAIRDAPAMVLVFSAAANNSDEIKKELSLVSRYRTPVLALRIEDIEPSDAFAYELSTRQWIDAFDRWEESVDAVVSRLHQIDTGIKGSTAPGRTRQSPAGRLTIGPRAWLVAATLAVLLAVGGAWWLLRPAPATGHAMLVRLTGFERLSPDLPATMPDALRDEIIAAFNDDGVVGVSTASAPPPGTAPAYGLGGTIRDDGDKIRVIARLTNERTGTTLWSSTFTYDRADVSRVPRHIAVDAGILVRCGLFGASTYPRPLPDPVMSDYLQACYNINTAQAPTKGLNFARKVVAARPDFSWGWSAIAVAALISTIGEETSTDAAALRQEGLAAADTAIRLDPRNSEALAYKSHLIDPRDLTAREALLQRALKARPLACGCEHHFYGELLSEVGRTNDAIAEFRRSIDVLALDPDSQTALASALLTVARTEDAKPHLDAAIDLVADPTFPDKVAVDYAPLTGDYAKGLRALAALRPAHPDQLDNRVTAAFEALNSHDDAAKSKAAADLAALPPEMNSRLIVALLGALGANREALRTVEAAAAARKFLVREWLFMPTMAGALRDPSFPAVAERLGLMRYWKTSHTRPDICSTAGRPAFCQLI